MKRVTWFQVNPCFKCNEKCSFCYVSDKDKDLEISNNYLHSIADFGRFIIDKHGMQQIKITYLGGEPLMVLPKVEYLTRLTRDLKCRMTYWLFTNGNLLTDETMRYLNGLGIFVVLSANQKDVAFLLDKCEIISKYQPVTRISLTLDRSNLERAERLSERVFGNGWHIRYFVQNEGFLDDGFTELYSNVMPSCLDIVDHYVKDPKRLLYLYENMDPSACGERSSYVTGRRCLVFDPGGVVRTTTSLREVGVVGQLGDGVDYFEVMKNYDITKLPRWSAQYIKECDGCDIRSTCQGGYPPPRYYAYGRFDKPSPYCNVFKKLTPKYIKIYNNKVAENNGMGV